MCRNCRGGGWKGVRVFGGGCPPRQQVLVKTRVNQAKGDIPAGIRGRQRHGEKGKAAGSPARTCLCCKRQKFTPEIKSSWHGAAQGFVATRISFGRGCWHVCLLVVYTSPQICPINFPACCGYLCPGAAQGEQENTFFFLFLYSFLIQFK